MTWTLLDRVRPACSLGSHIRGRDGTPNFDRRIHHAILRQRCPRRHRGAAGRGYAPDPYGLLEPGLVWVSQWQPGYLAEAGDHPERIALLAGMARKTPHPDGPAPSRL
jgi:hypothetical protein